MVDYPTIDMERLKSDMAAEVARTSMRNFSIRATGGKNPDYYRNMIDPSKKQDKRMSADVFIGAVYAMGRKPTDYIVGVDRELDLPNATVLTSVFAILLSSLDIDPYEEERAKKLAAQFPDVLRSTEALHARTASRDLPPEAAPPAGAEVRPST